MINNNYNIDNNKIIPLFNVPITMKKNFEIKSNKNIDLNKHTEAKGAILRTANNTEMVNLYSKALEKYNSNINNIENSNVEAFNKINLIEEIVEDSNNINTIYKNYLFLINRYLPYYVYYNSFFKLGLFLPRLLFKPQFYSYKYKGVYFHLNILPEGNFRQYFRKIHKNYRSFTRYITNTPFIKKNSLRRIIKGNLASLLLSYNRQTNQKKINRRNLIENYFTLNTNVSNSLDLGLEKINKASAVKKSKKIMKKSLFVDNNILPVQPMQISLINEIKQRQPEASSLLESSNTIKKVSLIWHGKEVNNLLNNIIEKGDSLINELNSLILEKQNLINNNKVNNLFNSIELNSELSHNSNNLEENNVLNNSNILNNSIYSENPIKLNYYLNNKVNTSLLESSEDINNTPIINQYLKSMSIYNMKKKGILIHYNSLVDYNFVKGSLGYVNKLIFKVQNLLQASFKSMYCLISKPLFIITPDKITIRLFYFLFVPNFLKYKKLICASAMEERGFRNRMNRKRVKQVKKQFNKFRKLKKNIRVRLRNLSNVALTKVFSNKFNLLTIILSKLFKKPVELDLTRLHYAYNDSNILVNLLGIMINKIKLRIIIRRLFEKAVIKNLNKLPIQRSSSAKLVNKDALSENNLNWKESVNIPAFLSGIKIKVGGRLLTQSVVPRQTVKITQRGATQRGKINFLDVARYTRKNKRGAFSITIKSGQNLF